MLRRHACTGLALLALGAVGGWMPISLSPAAAQTAATGPPQAVPQPTTPPPAVAAPGADPAPAAAQPSPAIAETPPAPPVDPLVAEVRRLLAEPAKGNVDRNDRAALAAFYAERNEPLIWVGTTGLTAKAR